MLGAMQRTSAWKQTQAMIQIYIYIYSYFKKICVNIFVTFIINYIFYNFFSLKASFYVKMRKKSNSIVTFVYLLYVKIVKKNY